MQSCTRIRRRQRASAGCGIALTQPLSPSRDRAGMYSTGEIRHARGFPNSAMALEPLVPQDDAILMSNHGVVTYGEDLERAFI